MIFKTLRAQGILGMNARNVDYILAHNPRHLYPLVDDKSRTGRLAVDAGIATPPIHAVIRFPGETADFAERMRGHAEFVVKPAQGSGGGGILVVDGHTETGFVTGRRVMTFADMRYHLTNILSGLYSLGGQPDMALVQYRVHADPFFDAWTMSGVPDVRVIVFRGVPVMAMLRLPTRESRGKANLHAGGIGVGVSIATGITTHGVYRNHSVSLHPDTQAAIAGRTIPHWDAILEMAARFCDLTGLGYLGVDIVIDRTHGPMMLEVNARPGIAIQVANRAGLKTRLQSVERKIDMLLTAGDRIAFAKMTFG